MNYYPFNVGDYAAHTAHLEPIEDLAYRRLLDQYYLRDGPLPADVQAAAKLVRMRSMASDVESVLREFFHLTEDGWRHKRCDLEIERMQDKQAKARASAAASVSARQAKQQAAAERSLASIPTDAERSLDSSAADAELPTPTPTPTIEKSAARAHEADPPEANGQPPTVAGSVCRAMRQAGLAAVNPGDPRLLALLEQGATEAELVGIATEAVRKSRGWAWVLTVVQARRAEAGQIALVPKPDDPLAWRRTADGVLAMADRLGLKPRPDELFPDLERRVLTAYQRAEGRQASTA